jgi:muramoyltetrapeptide carboxypeptidase LdcA involved in peptidoglycan recycling
MQSIIPDKLKVGDEVRIIAPSRSMNILNKETISIATKRLEKLGFKVSFGENIYSEFDKNYGCGSIKERIEDLHEAFLDKNIKAVLTVIGGFNSNQILDYINYDLIKNNPKIICGFSDVTALLNAIYAKTGLVTYYGPHYSSFGMEAGFDYTLEYFKKIFMPDKKDSNEILIENSKRWRDDFWFLDQKNRKFIDNTGLEVINQGCAEGTIIGGNLCTLNLLQGTEFMPLQDNNIILMIEEDNFAGKEFFREFDRNLQSLLHCYKNKNKKISGIIIGRAQVNCNMNFEKWKIMMNNKPELSDIPVVVDADFGHTTPIFTFPIGGHAYINNNEIKIKNI